jgi:hypothetical protein
MVEGVKSTMISLVYSKNFCEYCNVSPPSTTIENKMDLSVTMNLDLMGPRIIQETKLSWLKCHVASSAIAK